MLWDVQRKQNKKQQFPTLAVHLHSSYFHHFSLCNLSVSPTVIIKWMKWTMYYLLRQLCSKNEIPNHNLKWYSLPKDIQGEKTLFKWCTPNKFTANQKKKKKNRTAETVSNYLTTQSDTIWLSYNIYKGQRQAVPFFSKDTLKYQHNFLKNAPLHRQTSCCF